MRIGSCFLLSFSILLFSGCFERDEGLKRLWFYTHSTGPALNRDTLLNASSFMELRRDSSYTRDFGHFDYGKWSILHGKQLLLTSSTGKTALFDAQYPKYREILLSLGNGEQANFEGQSLPSKTSSVDPFSIDNNHWRIPASGKETDIQIKKRLFNHCQFWEAYFTWAMNNEITSVDVRSTPTLIKMYGNGFTLKSFRELPVVWQSYFFDAEDCLKANAIMTEVMERHTISFPHTDNKYKMFIAVFQQLEQYLQ